MDKKSAFQVLDFANEELRGKMKNLVWCDAEQKSISIAMPESAVSRKSGFPPFLNLPARKEIPFLYRPIKAIKN